MICRWCVVEIRKELVNVGPNGGRDVELLIDVDAHPDGCVVERSDGTFRRLSGVQVPRRPAYRIHGKKTCSPEAIAERAAAQEIST